MVISLCLFFPKVFIIITCDNLKSLWKVKTTVTLNCWLSKIRLFSTWVLAILRWHKKGKEIACLLQSFWKLQHWVTQWKNFKDNSVTVFVMITWKSSTISRNELCSNILELKYWVCGLSPLIGTSMFMKWLENQKRRLATKGYLNHVDKTVNFTHKYIN